MSEAESCAKLIGNLCQIYWKFVPNLLEICANILAICAKFVGNLCQQLWSLTIKEGNRVRVAELLSL